MQNKEYTNIPDHAKGNVVAIGNFDGVHLGHRELLRQAREIATEKGAPLYVLTFEPHPKQFFQPKEPPFRLSLLPAKKRLLAECGVDYVVALDFNKSLSSMTAKDFISNVLVKELNTCHVVVGKEFTFGQNRTGSIKTLEDTGLFTTTSVNLKNINEVTVSSTLIRNHIKHGDLDQAANLLGYQWYIESPIIHGDKRGRTINFPTANQEIGAHISPPYGIYAVMVQIEGESIWRKGVANFGKRPMFETERPLLETYIFDFSNDIYNKNMQVKFIKHLREEACFSNISELKDQIEKDCHIAKSVL